MKYLKQKLMAAVAMLVISTIMLTSASYAWFTISTAPEVTSVSSKITVNENFEIALGTTSTDETPEEITGAEDGLISDDISRDQTWGATITSFGTLTGDDVLSGLGPAVAEGSSLKTVTYGADGRPTGIEAEVDVPEDFDNGVGDLMDGENIIGKTILVWLRSNLEGTVSVAVEGLELEGEEDKVKVGVQLANGGDIAVPEDGGNAVVVGDIAENEATPVFIHIYLNGEEITNADVALESYTATIESIVFTHSAVDVSYDNPEATTQSGSGGSGSNP